MREIFFAVERGITIPKSRQAFKTIFYGGLTVGILDGLFAVVFYALILGAQTMRIFQSIAASLLGKSSYEGGFATFMLGIGLHFLVACCITTVYYFMSQRMPFLIRWAAICGIIYGMCAHLIMQYIVIPLFYGDSGKFSLLNFTVVLIGHAVLVGLPIALITRRYSK